MARSRRTTFLATLLRGHPFPRIPLVGKSQDRQSSGFVLALRSLLKDNADDGRLRITASKRPEAVLTVNTLRRLIVLPHAQNLS